MIDRAAPVAVVGAGTMGAGIAQVAAVAGHPVTCTTSPRAPPGGRSPQSADRVARLVAKGRLRAAV